MSSTYLGMRLVHSAIVLVGVSLIVFFLLRVMPGDPAKMLLPEGASQAEIMAVRKALGLDEPLYRQYALFVHNALRGDFGRSYQYRQSAFSVFLERVPATVELTIAAVAVSLIVGVSLGMVSALRRNTWWDRAAML